MPAKRSANKQLTHDNWDDDDDDEPEEAGVFQQADRTELKSRVIKRAKRRGVTSGETGDAKPVFQGFSGFGIPAQSVKPSFSFTKSSDIKQSTGPPSNGTSQSSYVTAKSVIEDNGQPNADSTSQSSGNGNVTKTNKSKFLGALKILNESVLKWLTEHMEKNPYCYFTPVLDDYSKHLNDLKARYNYDSNLPDSSSLSSDKPSHVSKTPDNKPLTSVFGSQSSANGQSPALGFTFGSTQKVIPTKGTESIHSEASSSPSKVDSSPSKACQTRPGLFAPNSTTSLPTTFKFGHQTDASQSSQPDAHKTLSLPTTFKFGHQTIASQSSQPDAQKTLSKSEEEKSKSPSMKSESKSSDNLPTKGLVFGTTATPQGFSFSASSSSDAPKFSFGSQDKPAASALVFGSGASNSATSVGSFSFKSAIAQSSAKTSGPQEANDEEEYVPPKPEVEKTISEDDALYTKRVKLFYEKDGKYIDRGIGNLFVKPVDGGKRSLLVRADTNLGNILLNIMLQESIPVKRVGKNNVSMMCIPNPPVDPKADANKPVMLLVRVKTEADADELCEKLNEYKKPADA